ncbi:MULTISPECIES: T6SS phospholipase effector Tle1-like catalytic domain-containing protein [Enterobacter]|uniref:T6SS phospholipase effector Tle1-like catalytic domain-containing protein n=1 Tax=Enterobacter TaxID=547 RepID=UPI001CBFA028|nr:MULTISPECIES: DUF2235 domain-containing protein [Enterobacter]UAN18657.1 DUF2235 domain-containing protein [Enterobacter asburiae]UAN24838.1 DUF2235 domain-containing protein [Enterobacter sp. JBIWA003]
MSGEVSLANPCWAPPLFPEAGRLPLSEQQVNSNYKKQIQEEQDYKTRLGKKTGRRVGFVCCQSVHISLFFDGTGNNEHNDTNSIPAHPTNIAKLFHASIEGHDKGYFRYYIPGVGTPFPKIGEIDYSDDGLKYATGGEDRINWALLRLVDTLSRVITKGAKRLDDGVAKGMLPNMRAHAPFSGEVNRRNAINPLLKTLEAQAKESQQPHLLGVKLFIYGFSRGAAEARTFINWLTQLPSPDKTAGYQPITLAGLPVSIEFVGLLDTVASVGAAHIVPGAAGHMGWADDTQPLPDETKFPGLIKCCRHFVSAHEQRLCFPLDSIRRPDGSYPPNCQEVVYPGMHSDVGGGYPPRDQGKSCGGTGEILSQVVLHDMYLSAFEAGAPLSVHPSSVTEQIKDRSPSRIMSGASVTEFAIAPKVTARFNIWRQTLLNTTLQGTEDTSDDKGGYRPYQLSQTLESAVTEQIGWITAWRIGRYAHGSMLPQGPMFANSFFNQAPQLKPDELEKEAEDHKAAVRVLNARRAEAIKARKPLDESLQGKPDLDPTNAQYQLREAAREFQHDYKEWVRDINGQSVWDNPIQIVLDVIPKHAVFLINGDDEAAEYEEMKADGNRLYPQLFIDSLGTGIRTQPRAELLAFYDEQIHDSRAWFMQSTLGGREPWGGYFRYRMIYCGNKANKKLQLISVEGKVVGAQPTSNRVVYLVEPKSAYKGEAHKVTDLATGSTQTLSAGAQSAAGYEPGSVASQTRSDTINKQHQAMMSSSIDMLKASGVKVL